MLSAPVYQPAPADLDALVAAYPFALLVSGGGASLEATPLPLFLEPAGPGERVFIGHFGRGNPQRVHLQADPRALIVFQGPHG